MTSHRTALLSLALLSAALGAGCELIKGNQETLGTVNQRVVGMAAGDFFQRYGRAYSRRELVDGSTEYDWASAVGYAPPGPEGLDDRICRLRLSVAKSGRIAAAAVLFDAQGRISTSRCRELFAGLSS